MRTECKHFETNSELKTLVYTMKQNYRCRNKLSTISGAKTLINQSELIELTVQWFTVYGGGGGGVCSVTCWALPFLSAQYASLSRVTLSTTLVTRCFSLLVPFSKPSIIVYTTDPVEWVFKLQSALWQFLIIVLCFSWLFSTPKRAHFHLWTFNSRWNMY